MEEKKTQKTRTRTKKTEEQAVPYVYDERKVSEYEKALEGVLAEVQEEIQAAIDVLEKRGEVILGESLVEALPTISEVAGLKSVDIDKGRYIVNMTNSVIVFPVLFSETGSYYLTPRKVVDLYATFSAETVQRLKASRFFRELINSGSLLLLDELRPEILTQLYDRLKDNKTLLEKWEKGEQISPIIVLSALKGSQVKEVLRQREQKLDENPYIFKPGGPQ
ncbi:MAG: hypothetical protein QXY76_03390 [Nitrososphaeria archaeon]